MYYTHRMVNVTCDTRMCNRMYDVCELLCVHVCVQEVTPPVACTRRTRSEVSDDDEGDDDDDANSVGAGAAA